MEYIPLLFIGILLIILGIANLRGDLSAIHRYNRRRVREEDMPRYGRAMGLGTVVMGASIALTAVLQMVFHLEAFYYIIAAGITAGIAVMLYAQLRYNKGIF